MKRLMMIGALALGCSVAQAQDNLVDYAAAKGAEPRTLPPISPPQFDPGPLTVFDDRDDFDAVFSPANQSCEDFEDTNIPPSTATAENGPLDSDTDTVLFPAGSIVPGLTIDVPSREFNDLAAIGVGFAGYPSNTVVANFFVDPLDLFFDTAPFAVALDVVDIFGGGTATVSFYDTGDVLIGSVGVAAGGAVTGFVGVSSPVAIGRVVVNSDADGAEGGDDICFTGDATARFKVTKTFSDGNDAEIDVMLTCNSGLPLEQSFTIAGGDEEGVTFVVTDIPESGATCEVTESGGPAGYTTVLNGGAGCTWEGVTSGFRVCEITNEANPATYTVFKDWTVQRTGGDVVIGEAHVTIECDSEILNGGDEDDGTWTLSGTLSDGQTLVATVDTTEGSATCSATETITESGVEQSASGCGEVSLPAGGSHTCTFTNTVFFEGIPTLSQYGLAVLVLLTLGVGFVGLRRFV